MHYHFPQKQDLGIAVVKRYADSFFETLEKRAASASGPDECLQVLIGLYREALAGSGNICLCSMLGAESPGLPPELATEVAGFLAANIEWLARHLDKNLDPAERTRRATGIIATLHGAMMLSRSLDSLEVFDRAASTLKA